jgi:ABC-type sugar transport system permease subunit
MTSSRKSRKLNKIQVQGLLYVLPVVLGTLFFDLLPFFVSGWLSFTNWRGFGTVKYVGLKNFEKLVSDEHFVSSLLRTFYYVVGVVPPALILGLFLAVLLYQRDSHLRGAGSFRILFFIPYVTSPVAIGVVWRWIYNNNYGLINGILQMAGLPGQDWLGTVITVMPALIVVGIWKTSGYNMILFMSGLSSIPEQYYEAATIDGGSPWQKFRFVTLPLITPIMLFIIIISLISTFQIFGLIYVMTGGGPGFASNVIIYYLYLHAFEYMRFGYASAIVLVVFLIFGTITWMQWKLSDRWVFYQ